MFLALFFIAACQTNSEQRIAPEFGAGAREDVRLTPLNKASLPPQQCGAMLWRSGQEKPVVMMRIMGKAGAQLGLSGQEVSMRWREESGDRHHGVAARQHYYNEVLDITARLQLVFGLPFSGGTYVERGLVLLDIGEDTRMIVPVAGIAGCALSESQIKR